MCSSGYTANSRRSMRLVLSIWRFHAWHRIYSGAVPKDNGVLPFVPPFCAALQCTEAAKLLTGRQVSANKLYIYDLCSMDFEVINL